MPYPPEWIHVLLEWASSSNIHWNRYLAKTKHTSIHMALLYMVQYVILTVYLINRDISGYLSNDQLHQPAIFHSLLQQKLGESMTQKVNPTTRRMAQAVLRVTRGTAVHLYE